MALADLRGGAVRVDYLDFGRGLSLSRQTVNGVQVLQVQGGELAADVNLQAAAGDEITINEDGVAADFRVESDNNTHMLFIDGSADQWQVGGTEAESYLQATSSEVVVNEDSAASIDFRCEGTAEPNLLFVDCSAETVGIGGSPPTTGGATDAVLSVINDTGGAALEALALVNDDGTAATAGDLISMQFFHMDANATPARALVSAIDGEALSNTDGAVDGGLVFRVAQAGTLRELLTMHSTGAGGLEVTFNDGGLDVNYQFAGDGNPVIFAMDGGLDSVGFGGGPTGALGAFFSILGGASIRDMVTSVGMSFHVRADGWQVSTANETTAVGANVFFGIPDWSGSTASHTITDAANVRIEGAPTNGGNTLFTNGPYALHVAGGASRFDGGISNPSGATTAGLAITNDTATQTSFHALQLVGADAALGADNDEVYMTFHMRDEASGPTAAEEQARITVILQNAEAGAMDSQFVFNTMIADTLTAGLTFGSAGAAAAFSFGFGTSNFVRVAFTLSEATSDFELDDSETTLNNQQVLRALISTLQSHGILV